MPASADRRAPTDKQLIYAFCRLRGVAHPRGEKLDRYLAEYSRTLPRTHAEQEGGRKRGAERCAEGTLPTTVFPFFAFCRVNVDSARARRLHQPRSFCVRLFAESFLRGKFGISSYNSYRPTCKSVRARARANHRPPSPSRGYR